MSNTSAIFQPKMLVVSRIFAAFFLITIIRLSAWAVGRPTLRGGPVRSRRRGTVFTSAVCLSVYSQKTAGVRITKLCIEMFHHESINLGSEGQRSRSRGTKNSAGRRGPWRCCECWPLLAVWAAVFDEHIFISHDCPDHYSHTPQYEQRMTCNFDAFCMAASRPFVSHQLT